ncbi:MAG: hypothetical protein B7Z66_15875 [Chromatiales bacterium 21-64-14]|nr:MAG: hypothetical protein B7Z66_15875 [Chromatiales bacterium 21-64-14]HQU17344.1 efflux transporter outer membrane subunit [Gammaproteobacteria bacterium]
MKFHVRVATVMVVFLQTACAPALPKGPSLIQGIGFQNAHGNANAAVQPHQADLSTNRWWHVFRDPNLNRLVAMALKNNPGLAEASARMRLAQAELLRANAAEWPHFDSINQVTRAHLSDNGNHAIYNGTTSTVGEIVPLLVSYHLDVFGEDRENIAAARAGAEAVHAEYRQSALMLSAAVIKTYFALAIAQQLVDIQGGIVKLSKSAGGIQAADYRAGIQSAVAMLTTRVEIQNAESTLAAIRQKEAALGFALATLLGKGPAYRIPVTMDARKIPVNFKVPGDIDMDIIAQRPDIQAALWNIRHAVHVEKSARAAFYPNINLRALVGFNSVGISNLLKASSFLYAFGPAVSLPIFEGGALEGRFKASASAYDMAVFYYNKSVLAAVSQVATDLAALEHSKEQLNEDANVVQQSAALVDVAASQFNSGIADKIPLIQAKIQFNIAIKTHLEETLNWISTVTDAATALGGGFQRWSA